MQDRFERFVVSITELHRYLQKLKELENQREVLRQEKIVKAYKETMLKEKQEWICSKADHSRFLSIPSAILV